MSFIPLFTVTPKALIERSIKRRRMKLSVPNDPLGASTSSRTSKRTGTHAKVLNGSQHLIIPFLFGYIAAGARARLSPKKNRLVCIRSGIGPVFGSILRDFLTAGFQRGRSYVPLFFRLLFRPTSQKRTFHGTEVVLCDF